MAQTGIVESIKEKNVYVKVIREEACAHCKMCTTGINEGKECVIEAVNKCGAHVGDKVEIDVQNNYFLRATAIMYGIPLVALMIGIILSLAILQSQGVKGAELISAFIGLGLTAIVYTIINKREKNNKNTEYLPIAVSKLDE
ncbi:MAG TPA: SoxR reducing system RseC family protein [Epulopiscium sp.]|nr:SoxR reducing system RseC family protein [Candidatus Epulonipiscium sp.]